MGRGAVALAIAAALVAPLAAAAQTTPQPSPPALERLHEALRLSPAQETAWAAFAAAAAPDPAEIARHRQAANMLASLPAPRRADLMVAVMRADLAGLERRAAAMKTFYDVLSPAQQALFDRQTAPSPEQGP